MIELKTLRVQCPSLNIHLKFRGLTVTFPVINIARKYDERNPSNFKHGEN